MAYMIVKTNATTCPAPFGSSNTALMAYAVGGVRSRRSGHTTSRLNIARMLFASLRQLRLHIHAH